jgi:hypothetical protein
VLFVPPDLFFEPESVDDVVPPPDCFESPDPDLVESELDDPDEPESVAAEPDTESLEPDAALFVLLRERAESDESVL